MKITFLNSWIDHDVSYVYGVEMRVIREPMENYFKNKDYGSGCKEINYVMFVINMEKNGEGFQDGGHFELKGKKIVCSVDMQYHTSIKFNLRKEFVLLMKSRFINKAMDFQEFEIDEFDTDKFMEDLDSFFGEYIKNYKDGDLPLWPEDVERLN